MTDPDPTPRPAAAWKTGLVSLAATLAVWAWFTWPLATQVTGSIPSHTRREAQVTRTLIPGDHLQLLYHFWLFADSLAGRTPWFHNLYEFNTGDDAARRRPSGQFLPASAPFALGHALAGDAFGWNLSFVFSLWAGFWSAWRLARRFAPTESAAFAAAIPALLMPYRWAGLCDGSPTGFAMAWTPAVFLGLALLWREDRRRHAAGFVLALWMLMLVDTQLFYLTMLAVPPWLVFLWLDRPPAGGLAAKVRAAARTTLPIVLPGLAVAVLFMLHRNAPIRDSVMQKGRTMAEVAIFSPRAEGFLGLGDTGLSNDLLVGHPVALAALVVLAAGLAGLASRSRRREAAAGLFLLACAAGVAVLALGANGPGEGRLYELARRILPKFDSLRQPLKVHGLMPVLATLLLARALGRLHGRPRLLTAAAALVLAVLVAEYRTKINPRLCALGEPNRAYAAVAADADHTGRERRAVALPLWPGDSAWSSLYLHHFARHRIKGLNGYSPLTGWSYFQDVFLTLRALNQGNPTDAQLDRLQSMGIHHVLLHENAFPEKVSPWPVGVTLDRLRRHARLEPLAQDAEVHAFRIRTLPREVRDTPAPEWWFPSRRLGAESGWPREAWAGLTEDGTASGKRCVELVPDAAPLAPEPLLVEPAPNLRWLARVRGRGLLVHAQRSGGSQTYAPGSIRPVHWTGFTTTRVDRLAVDSPADWTWLEMPVELSAAALLAPLLRCGEGSVRVDDLILAAGRALHLEPGGEITLPARDFFHGGYSDAEGRVHLRPTHDPDDVVLYGPSLPLEPGDYEVTADPPEAAANWTAGWKALPAGGNPAVLRFRVTDNLPGDFGFRYPAREPLALRSYTLRRLNGPAAP